MSAPDPGDIIGVSPPPPPPPPESLFVLPGVKLEGCTVMSECDMVAESWV